MSGFDFDKDFKNPFEDDDNTDDSLKQLRKRIKDTLSKATLEEDEEDEQDSGRFQSSFSSFNFGRDDSLSESDMFNKVVDSTKLEDEIDKNDIDVSTLFKPKRKVINRKDIFAQLEENIQAEETEEETKSNNNKNKYEPSFDLDAVLNGSVDNESVEQQEESTTELFDEQEHQTQPQSTEYDDIESHELKPNKSEPSKTITDELKQIIYNEQQTNSFTNTNPKQKINNLSLSNDLNSVAKAFKNKTFDNIEFTESRIRRIIESTLFVMGNDGLSINDLKKLLSTVPTNKIAEIIQKISDEKAQDINSGLCVKQFGNKYKILTKEETHNDISLILNNKEQKPLNKAKLEVLAIIAYNNPCRRALIERVRGKDPTAILASLAELGLVAKTVGINFKGHPTLYSVTQKFYDLFGLRNLRELPRIEHISNENVQNILNDYSADTIDEE